MSTRKNWSRFRYMPCQPMGEDGRLVTASPQHISLSRRAATEGMVLLKNNGALPLAKGCRTALFGTAQADFVKGGGGSGDVTVSYVVSLLEGLEKKQAQGEIELFAPLSDFYRAEVLRQYADGAAPGQTLEPALPEELLGQAADWADAAIVCICRYSTEGLDRLAEPGDYFLSETEAQLLTSVSQAFKNTVTVLNVGAPVDAADIESKSSAVLLMWQPGMEGGGAAADIICGDAYPSGKLTDTFAFSYGDYPSSGSFDVSESYTEYKEDIFVGYRYFETVPGANKKVCWPFGFGLGYTTFAMRDGVLDVGGDGVTVSVTVTNTGSRLGREVVQVYCQPPAGSLDKPKLVLCGFKKTVELKPGESERISVSFSDYTFASYDDEGVLQRSSWLLEGGKYKFFVGSSVRDVMELDGAYEIDAPFKTLEQLSAHCVPEKLTARMRSDGRMQTCAQSGGEEHKPAHSQEYYFHMPIECPWPYGWMDSESPALDEVAEGKIELDDLIKALTDEQLIYLLGGHPNRGVANCFGIGDLEVHGIPNIMTTDGPAGLRIWAEAGVCTTAFPCATLLACTWNPELVYQVGAAGAAEVLENGIGMWLTPAINIHRDPLCGRNFEYYSEDPLVAGKMSSAMICGIQSRGVAASLKHFAANNREVNRQENDSRLSERALREIYLKGFEICVREAKPWTIMSSYNRINGVRASENRELLTDILRGEWGFDGMVTTDWWNHAEHSLEVKAGNDLKMPDGEPEALLRALKAGELTREMLVTCARRVLSLILRLA